MLTYNRDVLPCLKAIKENTQNNYELILVDNSCNYQKVYDNYVDKYIGIKDNEKVLSRNYGKLVAKGDYIACIDDDVIVYLNWDEIFLYYMNQAKDIVGVGECGWYVYPDLSNYNKLQGRVGNYVSVVTGYCWMHKNVPEGLLPYDYGISTWHDESWIQLQMREKGGRFMQTPKVCDHNSQRGIISEESWIDHDSKIKKIQKRFKICDLNLEEAK